MLIDGVKFACEPCKKGHRQSHCNHTDRPLFEIGKRGRPVTACKECRAARKINNCHRTCTHMTEQEKDESSHPLLKTLPNGSKDLASVSLIRRSSSVRSRSSASSAAPSTSRTSAAASAAPASEEELATVGRKKSISRPPSSRRSSSAAQKKPHDLAHGHLADHPTHVSTTFSPYPHHAVKEPKTSKAAKEAKKAKQAQEVEEKPSPPVPPLPVAPKPVLPHQPYSALSSSSAASPLDSVASTSGSSRASPAPPARSLSAPTAFAQEQQASALAVPKSSLPTPPQPTPPQRNSSSPADQQPPPPPQPSRPTQQRAMTTSELASAFFFRDFAEAAPTDYSSSSTPALPFPPPPPTFASLSGQGTAISASPPSTLPPTFSSGAFDYAAFLSAAGGVAPSATELPPLPTPPPPPPPLQAAATQPRVSLAPMYGSIDGDSFFSPPPLDNPSIGAAAAVETFSLPPLPLSSAMTGGEGRAYYEFATQLEPVAPDVVAAQDRDLDLSLPEMGMPFDGMSGERAGAGEAEYELPTVPASFQAGGGMDAFPSAHPTSASFPSASTKTASPALPLFPTSSSTSTYPQPDLSSSATYPLSDSFSSLPPPNPAIYGYPLHAVDSHAAYTSYASSSGFEGGFPSSNASVAASAYNSGYESATGGAASALERLDLDFDFSSDAFSPSGGGGGARSAGQQAPQPSFASGASSAVQSGGEEDAAMGVTDLDGILEWLASSASAGVFPPTSSSASTSGAGTPSLPSSSSAAAAGSNGGYPFSTFPPPPPSHSPFQPPAPPPSTVASLSSFTGNPSSGFSSSASSLRQSPLLPTSTFFNPAPSNFSLPPPSSALSSSSSGAYNSFPAPPSLLGPSEPGAVDEAGYEEDDEAEEGEPDKVRQRREEWSATVRAEGGKKKKRERNPMLEMMRTATITCADQAGGGSEGEEDEDGSGGSGGSGGEQDEDDGDDGEAEEEERERERAAAIRRSNAFTARFGLPLLDIDDGPDEDDLERFGIDEDWLRRVGTEEVRLDDDGAGEFGLGGGSAGGGTGWGVWEGFGEERGAATGRSVSGQKKEWTPVPPEGVRGSRVGEETGEEKVKKEEEWYS